MHLLNFLKYWLIYNIPRPSIITVLQRYYYSILLASLFSNILLNTLPRHGNLVSVVTNRANYHSGHVTYCSSLCALSLILTLLRNYALQDWKWWRFVRNLRQETGKTIDLRLLPHLRRLLALRMLTTAWCRFRLVFFQTSVGNAPIPSALLFV